MSWWPGAKSTPKSGYDQPEEKPKPAPTPIEPVAPATPKTPNHQRSRSSQRSETSTSASRKKIELKLF